MISIVAAMDEKGGIGKDNKIPWHIKEDLVRLKNLTKDHVVILGRKTYDSMVYYYDLSKRPMPGKLYLVITRDKQYKVNRENVLIVHSLNEALEKVRNEKEAFVIGGAQIFEQALPFVDKLYLTVVEGDYSSDTFFPNYSSFKKVLSQVLKTEGGYSYKFIELTKTS